MKTRNISFLIGFVFLLLSGALEAQKQDSLYVASLQDSARVDSTILDKIPPMQALIDSAIIHSPLLQKQKKQVLIRQLENSTIKQEWLKYINVFGTSNYGVYDNFSSIQDNTVIGSSINTGTSFRWSVGLTLSGAPLYDFFNKNTRSKIKTLEMQQEEDSYEDLKIQLTQLVIQQYNNTILSYQVMNISYKNVVSNYTQLEMSEQQFKLGELPIFSLANVREMYYKSKINLEKSKTDFQVNYLILQSICGINF